MPEGIKGAIVLFFFTGLSIFAGSWFENAVRKIAQYPTAQAKVLKYVEVEAEENPYRIDFEYTVNGEAYTKTGVHGDSPPGETINVYYNPDKPGKAYLEHMTEPGSFKKFCYSAAGIFAFLGICVLGFTIYSRMHRM
jgi:hypothetical protein